MPLTNYTFDQLIDFTRTTSGTFVGSNGLIQNSPQSRNLLTFTQEFDNAAWSKTQLLPVVANSTSAPDGTSTADVLTEDSSTGAHFVSQSYTSVAGTYTMSCYVKANGRNFVILYYAASNIGASFNLTTGAIGLPSGSAAPTSSSTQNVGNGWWRISMAFTGVAVGTTFRVFLSDSLSGNGSYTGNGTSGIFIWGAQLEQASTATDYTRNVGGLFPARFDYDPVTLAPRGILIEEQRVNVLLQSQTMTVVPWSGDTSGGTVPTATANAGIAPDGTNTATRLQINRGAGTFSRWQQGATVASAVYTASVWMKTTSGTGTANVGLRNDATGVNCVVTGTWQRFTVVTSVATINPSLQILSFTSIPGTDVSADILVWGAQLEAGAFATSYIPTVASQVTRTADQASIVAPMFAPWFNDSAGTFVVEADVIAPLVGDKRIVGANNATATFAYVTSSTGLYGAFDGTVVNTANAVSANTTFKGATAYDATNKNAVLNGGTVATAARSASVPLTPGSSIQLGSDRSAFSFLNGHIRRVTYYPTRLSDLQLQALTA